MLINRPRASRLLRESALDAVVATSAANAAYASDYLPDSARLNLGVQVFAVVPADEGEKPALVLPSLELDGWAEQPGDIQDVTAYGVFHRDTGGPISAPDDVLIREHARAEAVVADAVEALASVLAARGLTGGAVGLDESGLSPLAWERIHAALPKAKLVPAAALLKAIRAVKTDEEIRRLRRSAQITSAAIARVFAEARQGVTERQLARVFETAVVEMGASPGFALVSVGRRTGHTHSRRSDAVLRQGDLIKQDMGCVYELYWSDVGRTKILGQPDERLVRTYDALCEGVRRGAAAVRPGIRASEVFGIATETVRELGLPGYRRHHTGHGVGITVYDLPLIQPAGLSDIFGLGGTDPILESGMIVNIETPYYRLGEYGMIVEDTLVVRDDGAELLTPLDYSLALAG